MNTKSRFSLHLLLAVLSVTALTFSGINAIKSESVIQEKESSYTLTTFDYVALSPSKDQVTQLRNNTEAVKSDFPCYNFEADMTGKQKARKLNLLLSDQMEYYATGLFNNSTLISGNYDESGIMLDKKAAEKLDVVVGDQVNVTLAYQEFTFNVSGIYMTSTYTGLDKGLALAKYSTAISDAYGRELQYDYLFIDANDNAKCANLLKSYVPMGELQSEADYTATFKSKNNCPNGMTEEEWNESIKVAYNSYKANFLSGDFTSKVQVKSQVMQNIIEQNSTAVQKVNYGCIAAGVVTLVGYIIISVTLISVNKHNDIIDSKDGSNRYRTSTRFLFYFTTFVIFIVSFAVLLLYGVMNRFVDSFMPIILCYSLPVLGSIIIVEPFIRKYISDVENEVAKLKKRENNRF